jgi:putative ABC transport system permease protein
MSTARRWLHRLRNALAPGRAEAEASREIDAHLHLIQDDLIRRGMPPDDARAAARRALGGVGALRRTHQDVRSIIWLDDLRRDTAYAVRTLARSPGFTAVAVATLAIATGASTAVFSIVDHVLVRSLPLPHADRLVRLYESNPAEGQPREGAAPATVADWRRAATSFDRMTTIGGTSVTMTGGAEPEVLVGMLIDPAFFALTGARLALGHSFVPDAYDASANAKLGSLAVRTPSTGPADIIISHAVWRRQFGADPTVVGRAIELNGAPAVVAGVMSSDFRFDETAWGTADCWIPFVESNLRPYRRFRQYTVIGRLKPGASLESARAEMTAIAAAIARDHPADSTGWTVRVERLKDSLVNDTRLTLLILLGGVACVLLIAGANVANLLLLRATGRSREVAIRIAIGAGRSRLVRQWLTESTLLALVGGLAGFLLAAWAVPVLVAHAPIGVPHPDRITVDRRIFAFAAALSAAIGLGCGLAPALGGRRASVGALRAAASAGEAGLEHWMRLSMVVAQIGLAIVLLVGAGLLARTLMAVHSVPLGFEPSRVLTFGVQLRGDRYEMLTAMRAFSRELVDRLQAIPGVEAAGVGGVPLVGGIEIGFVPEGRETILTTAADIPSPGYFRALGIRLSSGRLFGDADGPDAPAVAIVNRAFARTAWNTDEAVGRRLRVESAPLSKKITVVGVVDDVRVSSLEVDPPPVVYLPYLQSTVATYSNFVVRTSGDPHDVVDQVKDAVRSLDPSIPVTRVATMDERVARLVAPRAFNFWLIGTFSAIALLLATVGLYGLVSEAVASRTRDIAVRMALGAGRRRVLLAFVGRTATVAGVGTTVGLGGAMVAARWLGAMLYGVGPLDPLTLGLVPVVFFVVAIAATLVPAHRASRVDPAVALRHE